jgi:hypothetical protein
MAMTFTAKEWIMDREHESNELIELGTASTDTRGSLVTIDDEEGGFRPALGLSND